VVWRDLCLYHRQGFVRLAAAPHIDWPAAAKRGGTFARYMDAVPSTRDIASLKMNDDFSSAGFRRLGRQRQAASYLQI